MVYLLLSLKIVTTIKSISKKQKQQENALIRFLTLYSTQARVDAFEM